MKNIIIGFIALFITNYLSAQCISSSQSKFPANSEKKIDTVFNFDYKINSNLEIKTNGEIKRLHLIYYVNTQDGSMFFTKGFLSANNMDSENEHFRFDGTVWISNRQMVAYVLDIENQQKRAMTVSRKKYSTNEFMGQHLAILSFFNDREDPEMTQETPEPLPESFSWNGITQGYTGKIYNESAEAKMIIYFDKHPLSIKTSTPMVGFLAGVVNFLDINKCNKLAVFTKIEQENGDYIQEELLTINEANKTFNATQYKPFALLKEVMSGPGSGMQNMKANMAEFQSKAILLGKQLQKLQKEKEKCIETVRGDNSYCNEKYDSLIKENKQKGKQLQYELMKKMGAEDMIKH